MPYDEELAGRIRRLVADEADVAEKRMFGGVAFLAGGSLAIAASGQGGILVRVDPADADRLVDETAAEVAVMRNRPLAGWLRLASEHLAGEALEPWVERAVACARSLPAKG